MRIVIELKRGAEPQIVLNQLFKHTQMQESFSMILLAVVNGQPREMGLIQTIKYFIEHRVDVVRRRTAFLLRRRKIASTFSKAISPPSIISTTSSPSFAAAPTAPTPARTWSSTSAARKSTSTPRAALPSSIPRSPSPPSRPTLSSNCNCIA